MSDTAKKNLWQKFQEECPIISRIPIFGIWGFGVFAKAYFETKSL